MPLPNAFSLSKGLSAGRFKYVIYRSSNPDTFHFTTPDKKKPSLPSPPSGSSDVCEGVKPGSNVIHESILLCLFDSDNIEQIDFIKSVSKHGINLYNVDVTLPLYKIQNDVKMLMWSIFNNCEQGAARHNHQSATIKRIKHISFVIYPLITQDELECIIRTIIPIIRPYYCFASGNTMIDIVLFSLIPVDASLHPRLNVLGQVLDVRFTIICMAGDPCATCPSCVKQHSEVKSAFFIDPIPLEQTINFAKMVHKLEHRLLCMGNLKGLIVSNKMQSIFNRMQYIEEKYRNLQHHLMTDTTYDGMLNDIEHIETKIKDVAVQIPLSYIEANNLLHKIVTYKPPAHLSPSDACSAPQNRMPHPSMHSHITSQHVGSNMDTFYIPGKHYPANIGDS